MKRIYITSLLLAFCIYTHSQDSTKKLIRYKITVKEASGIMKSGYLAQISDSLLSVSSENVAVNNPSNNASMFMTVDYSQLRTVQLRRKGSVGRGILFGALAGLATGAIVGLISGDDPPCQHTSSYGDPYGFANVFSGFCEVFRMTAAEKAVAGGTLGMFGGGLIGGIIGAVAKKKFIINGSKEKFDAMQLTVIEKVYGKSEVGSRK